MSDTGKRAWEWITSTDPPGPFRSCAHYNDTFDTLRLPVPGGWLYRVDMSDATEAAMCFVPDICTTYRYPGEKT